MFSGAHPSWSATYPLTITDSRGVAMTLKSSPKRLVSLTPGATEMLFAVGAGPRVVGDTTWCNYPPAARNVPKIGDLTPNYERIVAAHPDLVIVDNVAITTAPARLKALHIPFFVIHPDTFQHVEDTLVTLGKVTGNAAAGLKAKRTMEAKKRQAETISASYRSSAPRVLAIVGVNPLWAAGRSTFMDDVIRMAGATNTAGSANGYASISKELVISRPPDVILASRRDQAALKRDAALGRLSAVRSGRVADIGDDILVRPGPRLADGLVAVAQTLQRFLAH